MIGPSDWSQPGDFDPTHDHERPVLVASPVAAERRGGRSLAAQAELDRQQREGR